MWRLRKNRLVTLAGCETGIGPQAEGETPWGLIPAFLNAGAPALIVSMLPVDDASTVQLTSRFYELLERSYLEGFCPAEGTTLPPGPGTRLGPVESRFLAPLCPDRRSPLAKISLDLIPPENLVETERFPPARRTAFQVMIEDILHFRAQSPAQDLIAHEIEQEVCAVMLPLQIHSRPPFRQREYRY